MVYLLQILMVIQDILMEAKFMEHPLVINNIYILDSNSNNSMEWGLLHILKPQQAVLTIQVVINL